MSATVPAPVAEATASVEPARPRQARPRLRELDLLRFAAALAVMLHHFVGRIAGWGPENYDKLPGLAPLTHYGNLGVDLFFLISGFVILMSAWGRTVGDFAVSRVTRIFPAYWFAIVLALVVYLITGFSAVAAEPDGRGPLRAFLPNLTMLQTGAGARSMEDVYWTLWIELHFYVLIALLVARGITYRRCVLFMVTWLLAAAFAHEARFEILKAMLFPNWAPYFIAGMAFFLMHRYGPNLVLGLIAAACWALAVYHRVTVVNPDLRLPGNRDIVIAIGVTLAFLLVLLAALGALRWLGWRCATVLGGLTYPLYLLHETLGRVLWEWFRDELGHWEQLALSSAVALTASYLVYRFVEGPAQRWLRPRLTNAVDQIRREGEPAAAVGASSREGAEPSSGGPVSGVPVL